MQNPDTISRRDAATRGWPGASSHQLRLEINRRQMRRVAGRAPSFPPSPCLADFSHPLPTIRLFSTNTKRYTRPTTPPPLYIYIPSSNSFRLFGSLLSLPRYMLFKLTRLSLSKWNIDSNNWRWSKIPSENKLIKVTRFSCDRIKILRTNRWNEIKQWIFFRFKYRLCNLNIFSRFDNFFQRLEIL